MRIIIIGCGHTGAGLARELSLAGHAVTVVDSNAASFERLGPSFKGEMITGVGFDRDVLLRAGIERADGLGAVTSSDETNVVTARVAREVFHVPKVVARVYDPRKAEIYRRLGLQTISPVSFGIQRLAELLTFSRLERVQSLGSGEVDIVEAEVSPLVAGRTVKDLTVPDEVRVVAITRSGKTFLPTMGTIFQEGDRLHIAVLATSADRLKALLGIG
jgi:trk system potassium uptake protein TrkA